MGHNCNRTTGTAARRTCFTVPNHCKILFSFITRKINRKAWRRYWGVHPICEICGTRYFPRGSGIGARKSPEARSLSVAVSRACSLHDRVEAQRKTRRQQDAAGANPGQIAGHHAVGQMIHPSSSPLLL